MSAVFYPSLDSLSFYWGSSGEGTSSIFLVYQPKGSPWKSAHVIVTMTLGLVMMLAFCVWENFAPYPMIPGYAFKNKVSAIININTEFVEDLSRDVDSHWRRRGESLFAIELLAIGSSDIIRS